MRSVALAALASLLPLSAVAAEPAEGVEEGPVMTLLSFDAMYGVEGTFLEGGRRIRGIPGDALPWELRSAKGTLRTDGHLTLEVRGLVFPDEGDVPTELRGKNDDPFFRAAVSCLAEDEETGQVRTVNVISPTFAATEAGDSTIDAMLDLPEECIAPVVLVLAGSEMKSYAIGGAELHE